MANNFYTNVLDYTNEDVIRELLMYHVPHDPFTEHPYPEALIEDTYLKNQPPELWRPTNKTNNDNE